MKYKNPESILVAIFEEKTHHILLLQRQDDPNFWQSVTGSIEDNETPKEAAIREVLEETGIDIRQQNLTLIDCQKSIVFDIFPAFRYKYAPNVHQVKEHWFLLPLKEKSIPRLTEHLAFQWVEVLEAVKMTKSWNNAQIFKDYLMK